jgi:protein-S-isoprenylcysteine O-methyltransferase Ste14
MLNKLHELEFNFRLQITAVIAAAALVTPMFTNIRIYQYFGVAELSAVKYLYASIGFLCFAAFIIRAWGAAYLSSFVVMAKNANQDKLIVAGPFKYVRNPLYFGDILGAGAIGLALPPEGFLIMIAPLTLHSIMLALYEEKNMMIKYGGDYREFLLNTNRLIPSLKPYKHSKYDEFISKYTPDWTDAIMSNIYFAGIGGAFIAAAFAGYSAQSLERLAYIYSIVVLSAWSVFYIIYYHPRYFMNSKNINKNNDHYNNDNHYNNNYNNNNNNNEIKNEKLD